MKPIIQLLTLAAATLFVSCAALSNLMLPVTQGDTMTFNAPFKFKPVRR